jgi:hypothetical protein
MRTSRTTRASLATFASAAAALSLLPASAGALALSVTTDSPQDVAAATATLRATVSVSALGANVAWQYGTTTGYGTTSQTVGTSLLGVGQTLTLPVGGLTPGTTYHLRAIATSLLSTAYGRDVSFTTARAATAPGTGDDGQGEDGSGSGSSGSGSSGSGSSGSGSSGSGSGSTTAPSTTATFPTTTLPTIAAGAPTGSTPTPAKVADDPGATDPAAAVTPGDATAAVAPVLGKTLAIAAVQGTVTATSPSGAPVDLSAARAVPTGTVIDARAGTVELTTALDAAGATQTGHFWGGRFEVRQSAKGRGLTQLVLRGGDFSRCGAAARRAVARAATKATKKKKPVRALWGSDDHGRFETRGRGSVATVRGTRWLTRDTCAGTLTRVAAGTVAVADLRRGRTIVVPRGHEYLARVQR